MINAQGGLNMDLQLIYDYWPLISAVIVWDLLWKGAALWIAARQSDKPWFVALLVLNTIGILPLAYIYVFSKREKTDAKPEK